MNSHYGIYGGQYVAETLMPCLIELEAAWLEAREDPAFGRELDGLLRDYVGRETPLTHARRLSEAIPAARYVSPLLSAELRV